MHRVDTPAGGVNVTPVVLPEIEQSTPARSPRPLQTFANVPVTVAVLAGRARLTIGQIRELSVGSVVALDRAPEDGAEILINGVRAASADTIVVDDELAARLTGLAG